MPPTLRRALPCALLALLAPVPATAAAPPALAGTVVVTATRTAYADVTLPRTVVLPATPALTAANDALTGLALVRVQAGTEQPGVAVFHLPGTTAWHYVWIGRVGGETSDPSVNHTHTLPAGRYRLYVRTSGPTSLTWRLPLTGRRTISARAATGWTYAETAATGVPGTAVAPAYVAEQTGTAAHRGLVLGLLWWDAAVDSIGHFGGCTYSGASSPAELGPVPACTVGDGFVGPTVPAPGPLVALNYLVVAPGTWTDKEYVRVYGVARAGGVSSSLLDLGAGFPAA